MSDTIGEVNINLRMSLKQFAADVQAGNAAAGTGARAMADGFKSSSREATGSLALISEELGITIPRHLRSFIASMPGVGTALNAAFSSVAVIALIGVIVEIVEKIQAWKARIQETADAWEALGEEGKESIRKLDEQLLSLQARIEELKGNHLAALQDELQLINAQTMDGVAAEFDKIGKKADDAFSKMKVSWFENLAGMGDNKDVTRIMEQFDSVKKEVLDLAASGNAAGISAVLDAQIAKVKEAIKTDETWAGTKAEVLAATKGELSALEALSQQYAKFTEVASDKKGIATMQEQGRATAAAAAEVKKLADELEEAMHFLDSKEANSPRRGGPRLDSGNVDPSGIFGLGGAMKGIGNGNPQYGGTKESRDQLNLLTDQNQQLQMASDLYTATRTNEEKYANEMQVLNTLLASGAIDQDTYNRSVSQAKAKYDDVARGLAEIGNNIGQNIAQAALYGGSWTKAFQDIAAEIIKVILQMTILKSLQQSAAASGSTGMGFLSSIFGGLTGHADGGPMYQGQPGWVGERGPEIFVPSTSGTIIPNHMLGSGNEKAPEITHNEFHFHGVADADSFRRSQRQIAADMAASLSRANQRRG